MKNEISDKMNAIIGEMRNKANPKTIFGEACNVVGQISAKELGEYADRIENQLLDEYKNHIEHQNKIIEETEGDALKRGMEACLVLLNKIGNDFGEKLGELNNIKKEIVRQIKNEGWKNDEEDSGELTEEELEALGCKEFKAAPFPASRENQLAKQIEMVAKLLGCEDSVICDNFCTKIGGCKSCLVSKAAFMGEDKIPGMTYGECRAKVIKYVKKVWEEWNTEKMEHLEEKQSKIGLSHNESCNPDEVPGYKIRGEDDPFVISQCDYLMNDALFSKETPDFVIYLNTLCDKPNLAKNIAMRLGVEIENLESELAVEAGNFPSLEEHLYRWSGDGKVKIPDRGTPEYDEIVKEYETNIEIRKHELEETAKRIDFLKSMMSILETKGNEPEKAKVTGIGELDSPVVWLKNFSCKNGMTLKPLCKSTADVLDVLYRISHLVSELMRGGAVFRNSNELSDDTVDKIEKLRKYLNDSPHSPICPRNCDIIKNATDAKKRMHEMGGENYWDTDTIISWMLEPYKEDEKNENK